MGDASVRHRGAAEYAFTFHSTHDALYAEKRLVAHGMRVRTMPLPAAIRAGCGICLRVDAADFSAAARLLQEADARPGPAFALLRNGAGEREYRLCDD